MALYIFLPVIFFALIIIIILLLRKSKVAIQKKSSEVENNGETENQEGNDQSITVRGDVYTELDQNREPDDTYMSLVHYENSNEGFVRSFVIDTSNVDYINEPVITTPEILSSTVQDYEIPDTNDLVTLEFQELH